MPSVAPLTAAQIAEFFGAIDELLGTGDNVTTAYQLDFFPAVGPRTLVDDLIGLGDGIDTSYQINFFPITSGSLTLRKTSVTGPTLVDPTHYSVVLATGVVTLTGTGVTFLGLETLRAAYTTPSTLELHKTTITGALLSEGTHYTVNYQTGAVTLTSSGVTFLGTDQLHAKYQITTGLVNVLTEANASLGTAKAQSQIAKREMDDKDAGFKYIHESIETKTILGPEAERRNLVIPGPTVAPPVTEAAIFSSIDVYAVPLYPVPPVGDPSVPAPNANLFGGAGTFAGNERAQIDIEQLNIPIIIAAGPDTSPWTLRFASASYPLLVAAVSTTITALTAQIAAITSFLALNPVPNDHVTATDISNATAASASASAHLASTTTFATTITTTLSNAVLTARLTALGPTPAGREGFIDVTRGPQLSTLLTFLWGRRFFWITQRARLADGTLAESINFSKAVVKMDAQIVNNNLRITEILTILGAQ